LKNKEIIFVGEIYFKIEVNKTDNSLNMVKLRKKNEIGEEE